MTTFDDYEDYDALGLAELVRRGEVGPRDLLFAAIERIDARDPAINAIVQPLFDKAREQVIAGLPEGPFHGVPFLLKDLYVFYPGAPCENGSRLHRGWTVDWESEIVTRYRRAGLVIVGKASTSELGISVSTETAVHGATRNPWSRDRTAGGSSGGSAAAVAAGYVPMAHASDGGGSIRIPASCCGLFGLKPSRGRMTHAPAAGEGWAGLATAHVVSRSVRDSAALLDATCGPAPGDPYTAPPPTRAYLEEVGAEPGSLRIAMTREAPFGVSVHEDCREAVERAARTLEDLGHHVEEAAPDFDEDAMRGALLTVVASNMTDTLDRGNPAEQRPAREDDVERVNWAFAERGRSHSAVDYLRAVYEIHRTGRDVAGFFETYDLFLTPTLAEPPVPLGTIRTDGDLDSYNARVRDFTPFTPLFNITGQPAASIPLHWNAAGLPIGIQLAARYGDEATLFRVASQLEAAAPWFDRRPALDAI